MEEGKHPGRDRAYFRHGPWWSRLDTYTVSTGTVTLTYTRVRAYFRGHRELRVRVRTRGAFDRLWSAMGFRSHLPVARELLDRFVVRGTPQPRVPSLFAGPELVATILSAKSLDLEMKPASRRSRKRYGEDTGVVVCQLNGVVTDVARLAAAVEVVRHTLEGLQRIGEANQVEIPES
jgi:hypothetical protein